MVIVSFVYQLGKHALFSGELKTHTILMIVTFSPYTLVFIFNHFRKYSIGRYIIIIYTLINNLFWTFTNVGQEANIYYANIILVIPVVIFFRELKIQIALILLTFGLFVISYYVDLNYSGYVINTYVNPNFNIIAFGIWLTFSFLMMRFLLIEINSAENAMKKQHTELEDFTRLASHDMKEPLRTIVSFSSLLKSKYTQELPKEANEYLDYIENGAGRLNNLLDDLSSYNSLSLPVFEKLEFIDLNLILNELIYDLGKVVNESSAKITIQTLPKLKVNPAHMRQLFQNLIMNGIKFQPKDNKHIPKVEIDYISMETYHEIIVRDNGIGISEINVNAVFQKFKRLHNRSEYDGTGIGLATCKKVMELYNGEIFIKSKVGAGTSIHIQFPRIKSS